MLLLIEEARASAYDSRRVSRGISNSSNREKLGISFRDVVDFLLSLASSLRRIRDERKFKRRADKNCFFACKSLDHPRERGGRTIVAIADSARRGEAGRGGVYVPI